MRIARIYVGAELHLAVIDGAEVVDLGLGPADLPEVLGEGGHGLDRIEEAARAALDRDDGRVALTHVRLGPPIGRPPKLLAIGKNYAEHATEMGGEAPAFPLLFNKQATAVVGIGDPIHVPRVSADVDYEGELAMVIGRRCRHVPLERAPDVVAGFTVMNDVSVRDWQRRSPTMTLGKSFDTHAPLGPWVVTADEVGDPHGLRLRTWVNGDLRQDASTADMIHSCWEQVALLSTVCTLEPGDVISTGTPPGVGVARTPPSFLRAGDHVRVEIERIGVLENPVIDEPDSTPRW